MYKSAINDALVVECMNILHFLKTNTLFIIDEIDSVIDLTKSLNFNTHHVANTMLTESQM